MRNNNKKKKEEEEELTEATDISVLTPQNNEENFDDLNLPDISTDFNKQPNNEAKIKYLSTVDLSDGTFITPPEQRPHNNWRRQGKEIPHHILINESFFIDPIRKFLRNGHFPFKLAVSCLIIIFLILIAVLFHSPESVANEQQRKAVLYQFLGDDYLGKDKGDIISRPTVYLHDYRSVLNDIRNFVLLYYALSNISISELKYYYYYFHNNNNNNDDDYAKKENDRVKALKEVIGDDVNLEHFNCIYNKLFEKTINSSTKMSNDMFDYNCILPVSIEFDAFIYSLGEHWGPSPLQHFEGKVTDKNPLGVFSDDYCYYNTEEKCDFCKEKEEEGLLLPFQNCTKFSNNGRCGLNTRNRLVNKICSVRYDEITGKYFSPCRHRHRHRRRCKLRKKDNDINNSSEDDLFYFPLIENVRKLRLTASMRHVTDAMLNNMETTSGFRSTIYHWKVEKTFLFHPGGLVEAVFDVSVITRHLYPYVHLRFFLTFGLLLLVIIDIFLRYRALKRLWHYNKRIRNLNCSNLTDTLSNCYLQNSSKNNCYENSSCSQSSCVVDEMREKNSVLIFLKQHQNLPKSTQMEKREKELSTSKLGSLLPETTYTDIHDVWRQQMMRSRGEGWHYIVLTADLLTVIYVNLTIVKFFGIYRTELHITFESIILGLMGFLYFLGLLSYIRYFPKTYFAIRAARHVIPRLFFFAISIAPIYVGFAFFFCIVFGPHSNGEFNDINFSLVALYFMMFGDAILPAIKNAKGSFYPIVTFLASCMTVVFILFFMMTMLNLAMSIIQHEWAFLRRRFGACLSVNNLLFKVRTRDQVRAEAFETIVTNLELLIRLRNGDDFEFCNSSDGCFVENSDGNKNIGDGDIDDSNKGDGDGGNALFGDCNENENNNSNRRRAGDSFVLQREVAALYIRRMDELTEGLLEEDE